MKNIDGSIIQEKINILSKLSQENIIGAVRNTYKNHSFKYEEYRFQDAIARIFSNFMQPCSAGIVKDNILYISYNGDKHKIYTQDRPYIDKLRSYIGNAFYNPEIDNTDSINKLLNYLMYFRIDRIDFIKRKLRDLNKSADTSVKECLKDLLNHKESFKTKLENNQEDLELYNAFFDLLITSTKSGIKNRDEIVKAFFRPIQDVYKLHYVFKNHFKNIDDIKILDNKDDIHAEIALMVQYPKLSYYGISKLCCFICGYILDYFKSPHIGNHNICFSQNMNNIFIKLQDCYPEQVEDFKKDLEIFLKELSFIVSINDDTDINCNLEDFKIEIKSNQKNKDSKIEILEYKSNKVSIGMIKGNIKKPSQDPDLSDDDFEKDIPIISEKLKLDTTLYNLKYHLKFGCLLNPIEVPEELVEKYYEESVEDCIVKLLG